MGIRGAELVTDSFTCNPLIPLDGLNLTRYNSTVTSLIARNGYSEVKEHERLLLFVHMGDGQAGEPGAGSHGAPAGPALSLREHARQLASSLAICPPARRRAQGSLSIRAQVARGNHTEIHSR